jgi:DNA-binding CsgD family transcriptional regulator
VFRLLISGRSVTEIGAQLRLAPNTVSTYRMRILEKTGARNDVELALLAERLRLGLLAGL